MQASNQCKSSCQMQMAKKIQKEGPILINRKARIWYRRVQTSGFWSRVALPLPLLLLLRLRRLTGVGTSKEAATAR